jgi:hypothetical protein
MAAFGIPRTTTLYDRTGDEIRLDEGERISLFAAVQHRRQIWMR